MMAGAISAPAIPSENAGSATITIASGKVTANLANFPLYVDLADMPAGFWTDTRDGRDLRAFVGAAECPIDLVWIDVGTQKGALFVKVPTIFTAAVTTIELRWNGASTSYPVTAPYGRNAVWSDYETVLLLGETGGDDRTGKSMATINGDPDLFELTATSSVDVNSHQGVCWDGTHFYTVDTNTIRKWSAAWAVVATNADPLAAAAIGGSPTVNHCGDPDVRDGRLYIPIDCYPAVGGLYNSHIAVFNAADLSFIESFSIAVTGIEAASIAYCDRDKCLYIVDYVSDNDLVYRFDPLTGTPRGTLKLDCAIPAKQGITWWHDYFWISQDTNDETVRVSYSGECSKGNLADGSGGIGFGSLSTEYEGIGAKGDSIVQLIDSGADERIQTWRPYRLAKSAQGGMRNLGTSSNVKANGRASLTTYTLAVSMIVDTGGANRCAVSYLNPAALASANQRQVIAHRHTGVTVSIWDASNSWLDASPAVSSVGTVRRVHAVYDGTTSRRLFVDGTQRNSQLGIVALPASRTELRLTVEDDDVLEPFNGRIGFVYLRGSALTAAWIAGEYANLNSPNTFYAIA
jgi:hypothetical protein